MGGGAGPGCAQFGNFIGDASFCDAHPTGARRPVVRHDYLASTFSAPASSAPVIQYSI